MEPPRELSWLRTGITLLNCLVLCVENGTICCWIDTCATAEQGGAMMVITAAVHQVVGRAWHLPMGVLRVIVHIQRLSLGYCNSE